MRQRANRLRDDLNPFLSKINIILNERNISPTHLSIMAKLGSSTLSNLLKRNNIPTFATLEKICAVLGMRMSAFIKDLEDTHPEMFIEVRSDIQRYDPLQKRKQQIIEDWSALPVNDRDETLSRMIDAYGKPKKDDE